MRIVLFVARRALRSTTRCATAIRPQIREDTSPHHVPGTILQVADIPRTKSAARSPSSRCARWSTAGR